ncbi:membrane protein insertase YidC [Kordiimonas sp. SCSIO 12610]|uniref:membrane protein insertase YidC n=1 Tax=Kordiimonas sp. SCSIO 12610 TaxID=2829597 RepID=UPI002108D046|nr:membrane protein insertase YidC [Kordiimonas sp. SCSIO 12610]UTW55368.1 membrane protein insertase YidC [Kordiimonas sp. SCSIO 12610]
MGENKNIILALVLSGIILFGYQYFIAGPRIEAQRQYEALQAEQAAIEGTENAGVIEQDDAPSLPLAVSVDPQTDQSSSGNYTYADAKTIAINNAELSGSISLGGARFDNLFLANHNVELNGEEKVQLLVPANEDNGYFVRFGWTAVDASISADDLPKATTIWTSSDTELTPQSPVLLRWTNAAGIEFLIKIELDEQFMFTVTQTVNNTSGNPIQVRPYGFIDRKQEPVTDGLFVLHEGPIGVFDDNLEEQTYEDLRDADGGKFESTTSVGGWMGITDKYWMTVLIPDQAKQLAVSNLSYKASGGYRASYLEKAASVPAGGSFETQTQLYAGAKIVETIDNYQDEFGIKLFDRSIDWGWLYFLTKPFFAGIHFLFGLTGNFGVAILLFTVVVKLVLFPLANKSYVSMSHMKDAQPKMKALQERYKDDRQKLQQEMMAFYKKEKINPLAGCLPILIQMPIFFALYKVLYVTIEMRHQPFFGWIQDLSVADPVTPLNLFGLIPFDPPAVIAIGIWPILMGVTMWLQQKLNPQTNMDPTQQKIMAFLPIIFTFIMARFSAGLVIYWTWNNLLSITQQWYIMRKESARRAAKAANKA